jgi:hypothetical protein
MALDFDMVSGATLLVDQENRDTGRRRAFRAEPPALYARIGGLDGYFRVNDISAGGLNLQPDQSDLRAGDIVPLDVLIAGRRYLSGLHAEVVRATPAEAALAFRNLSRRQELKLDKLVLEMQKRAIAHLKSEREAQEAKQPGVEKEADGPADLSIKLTL